MTSREPLTREELVALFDSNIESESKRSNPYWADVARKWKEKSLADFDEGRVICTPIVEKYTDHSMEWEDTLMSDGTVRSACYGYYD